MKKINLYITLAILLTVPGLLFSQGAPKGMNYQAVARSFNGEEIRNEEITVRFTIIAGDAQGDPQWVETHNVKTNEFGLFTVTIGQGTQTGGDKNRFSDIAWGADPHFLKVEIDFEGDVHGFMNMGTTQLLSVPYALYAEYAANGGTGGGSDPDDLDKDPENELQHFAKIDSLLALMKKNGEIYSTIENDFEPANEIQNLRLNDNILEITNNPDARSIDLSPYLDNTDKQTLAMEEDSIRISGGNAVDISELRNPESVSFYVRKESPSDAQNNPEAIKFTAEQISGITYNPSSGNFITVHPGVYSFYLYYEAKPGQTIHFVVNNNPIETQTSDMEHDVKVKGSSLIWR